MAMRPVGFGHVANERRVRDGRAVDRDLVGPGVEQLAHVAALSDPAADRERDGDGGGGAVDQVEQGAAILVRRRDVEERDLIGPGLAVALGGLDRVAWIAKPDEASPKRHGFYDVYPANQNARFDAYPRSLLIDYDDAYVHYGASCFATSTFRCPPLSISAFVVYWEPVRTVSTGQVYVARTSGRG